MNKKQIKQKKGHGYLKIYFGILKISENQINVINLDLQKSA